MNRQFAIIAFAALAAGVAHGADATWNYRAGIGASPANPARWADPANWLGGEPPSGETTIATFNAGEPHA